MRSARVFGGQFCDGGGVYRSVILLSLACAGAYTVQPHVQYNLLHLHERTAFSRCSYVCHYCVCGILLLVTGKLFPRVVFQTVAGRRHQETIGQNVESALDCRLQGIDVATHV